jgi:hypothetical protein
MSARKISIETNYQPAMTKNVTSAPKKPPTTKETPHYLSQDFSDNLYRDPEVYPFAFACKFYDSGCPSALTLWIKPYKKEIMNFVDKIAVL